MKTPCVLSLLVALLWTSSSWAAATAADTPNTEFPRWRVATESQYAWRNIEFHDKDGELRSLWCRRSECGPGVKAGHAKLYFFEVEGKNPWGWKDSGKGETSGPMMITYKTRISNSEQYDAATGKVRILNVDGIVLSDVLGSSPREKLGTVFRVKPPHAIHHVSVKAAPPISPSEITPPSLGKSKHVIKKKLAAVVKPADVKKDPKPESEARPAGGSAAAADADLDLEKLDKNEIENLTEAEKIAYISSLDEAKRKDVKAISAVISEYRKKASANKITTMPMNVEGFNALPSKEQKNKFCDVLDHSPNGGYIGGKVITRALDQGKAAGADADAAKSILDGAGRREDDAVEAAPQPHITASETSKLNEACKALRADKPAASGGTKKTAMTDIEGSMEGSSEGQGGGGEKKEAAAGADMQTLAKAGAVGVVAGAMIWMLGGPVAGAVIGAVAVFALLSVAGKILK